MCVIYFVGYWRLQSRPFCLTDCLFDEIIDCIVWFLLVTALHKAVAGNLWYSILFCSCFSKVKVWRRIVARGNQLKSASVLIRWEQGFFSLNLPCKQDPLLCSQACARFYDSIKGKAWMEQSYLIHHTHRPKIYLELLKVKTNSSWVDYFTNFSC